MRLKRNFVLLLFCLVAWLCACINDPVPVTDIPNSNPVRGRELISQYGCPACHVIPRVWGADNHVGPSLEHFAQRAYIAGNLVNTPENLIRWLRNPQDVEPHTAMPDMGINESDARDIAAYLFSLD